MAGLYLHIPFCLTRCVYCDFYSHTGEARYKTAFLTAALQEMALRKDYLAGERIETIYFGGGTPTRLTATELSQLFDAIYRLFPVASDAEVTLEANPDDLTPAYVSALRRLPVNRISIGVQSLWDDDLRFLRRRHNRRQALQAIDLCRRHGIDNLSLDLIYGLPGQTTVRWQRTLDTVLGLQPAHISAYLLTCERGTMLYRLESAGKVQLSDEAGSLAHYNLLTRSLADAGYRHYEISNFALPQRISRHNSAYWFGKPYLGIGPSAHSYDRRSRQWNRPSLIAYIRGMRRGEPPSDGETLSERARYNEYILTRLRTMWGISLSDIREQFGEETCAYCLRQAAPYIERRVIVRRGDRMVIARSAWFVSDGIIRELLRE